MAWRAFGNPKYTKRMIQMAKKIAEVVSEPSKGETSICYAFMPDKATGEHEFALDTGISGEMLFKKLRTYCNAERGKQKKKKLTKGSWGTCRIQGKTLYVMPEQDVPSLRMLLKRRLLSEDFKEFKLNECRILKPGEKLPAPPRKGKEAEEEEQETTRRPRGGQTESSDTADEASSVATQPSPAEQAQESQAASSQSSASPAEPQSAPAGDVNPFSGEPLQGGGSGRSKEEIFGEVDDVERELQDLMRELNMTV